MTEHDKLAAEMRESASPWASCGEVIDWAARVEALGIEHDDLRADVWNVIAWLRCGAPVDVKPIADRLERDLEDDRRLIAEEGKK